MSSSIEREIESRKPSRATTPKSSADSWRVRRRCFPCLCFGAKARGWNNLSERQKYQEVMTCFNDLAEDTGRNLLNNVRILITQNINPIVAAFDEKIKAVESMTTNEKLKAKNSPRSSTRRKSLSARLSMNKAQVLNAPVFFCFMVVVHLNWRI